jgi:trimethylamine:corrinoid methyltransferase-like protein
MRMVHPLSSIRAGGDGVNASQIEASRAALGFETVEMLHQVHRDALWMLENLGVRCRRPEIAQVFAPYEESGEAILHGDRIYLMEDLVLRSLKTVPGIDGFFVGRDRFFIGGTAPYVYDDLKGKGGLTPSSGHLIRIAKMAESHRVVAGMGRGVKLKNDLLQMSLMAEYCTKPLQLVVAGDAAVERAREIHQTRPHLMIAFCLTRPPLTVDGDSTADFRRVTEAGLPVLISAMPMAGVSAPYCYSGALTVAHAEVLFGICVAQVIHPGIICVHGGCPSIADPRLDYNPNYGLVSHTLLNILMAHLNMMLDIPTCQSAGMTHEAHPTERALRDVRVGLSLCRKYGVHMIRHPFGFLRYLVDFSFYKMENAIEIAAEVTADDAPEVAMPAYDERGMASIRAYGLGMYMDDPLTTANFGTVFAA